MQTVDVTKYYNILHITFRGTVTVCGSYSRLELLAHDIMITQTKYYVYYDILHITLRGTVTICGSYSSLELLALIISFSCRIY